MDAGDAFARLDARARFGQRLGLGTMRGMLAACGDFHHDLRVVHVAGTNGKGSVAAMVAAALDACGHKTGLYTSPHLIRFGERVRIEGEDMTDDAFADAMTRVEPALDAFPEATYFEVATLVALRRFVDAGVDVAVLEVGLGGRLDATNLFDAPLATVVTNVTLEHTETLGKTVPEIAREKGGVVKRGVPLVTGATGEALETLRAIAKERGADVRALGDDFVGIPVDEDDAGQTIETDGLRAWGAARVPLVGAHQVENATLALATLDALHARGLDVPVGPAREGLARTRWPGRLERLGGFILDAAHNPAGMQALCDHLATFEHKPVVVFGVLADKDWEPMVDALALVVREAVVTRVPDPRAAEPTLVARRFSQDGVFGIVVDDVGHALRSAEGIAAGERTVVVTGSLVLVGDARARLLR